MKRLVDKLTGASELERFSRLLREAFRPELATEEGRLDLALFAIAVLAGLIILVGSSMDVELTSESQGVKWGISLQWGILVLGWSVVVLFLSLAFLLVAKKLGIID
jgi:hypothetical protein